MDLIGNNSSPFSVFQNTETPKAEPVELNLPLSDSPIPLEWASSISSNGTPIVKDNTKEPESYMIVNNSPQVVEISQPVVEEKNPSNNQKITNGSKEDAVKFFMNKGLKKHQAAGIVGNLIQESNLNTSIKGDKGTSYGIAQWRGDRRTGLTSFAKELGTDISDFKTQLEYVWKELNSSHKSALNKLLKSKNSDEATIAFMKDFERPNEKYANLSARLQYAKSCLS